MPASIIPEQYARLTPVQLNDRIAARKSELGDRIVILGHHYQRDEVLAFADITGDSLKLSRQAARQEAQFIIFCGVHFMAESASVLGGDDQQVCLPNFRAGCAMADMADEQAVEAAMEELAVLCDEPIIPVTYVNSTAAVKAVTARRGGTCCTSGNVRNVFDWAFAPKDSGGAGAGKIFAVPDEHLARNTAVAMGLGEQACAVYDPKLPEGGLSREQVARAKVICWRGHCYVHQVFTAEDVRDARRTDPDARVIVHPECPREVVAEADAAGSTEQIIRAIAEAEPGSRWLIGTEANLVARLDARHPDRTVRVLPSRRPPRCVQMAQIDLPHLLWVLDSIAAGDPVNVVTVPEEIAEDARLAVRRMIEIKPVGELTGGEDSSAGPCDSSSR
jgi:quinolinate synthase